MVNLATIAELLTRLTKAREASVWGKESVFRQVKMLLAACSLLYKPYFSIPFVIPTDAIDVVHNSIIEKVRSARNEYPY